MYGDQIANEVAQHFMHELKKSYATELLQQSPEGSHHDERVIQIQAKGLLKGSNLTITEIAHQVGYYDSSYFTELFTKAYGLNPKEYRRLVRSKLFRVNNER